ncbi:MAG: HAD family hydrolase [Halolamina sp.]
MTVSVALDALCDVDGPADPAAAVAAALRARDVPVPEDWSRAWATDHVDAPAGAAVPLPARVSATLASRGVEAPGNAARRAVVAAFDPAVQTRKGAADLVAAARGRGPVAAVSDAAAPELTGRVLVRSRLAREEFDAVVSAVGCGWRRSDPRLFETVADRLDTDAADLVHVGVDDGALSAVDAAGGRAVDARERSLADIAAALSDDDSG